MTNKQDWNKAQAKSKDSVAVECIEGFYKMLKRAGKIVGWETVKFEENRQSEILDRQGCDTAVEREPKCFQYYEEKITFNKEGYFILELKTWQSNWNAKKKRKEYRKIDGWAVSEYKKTDILLYYVHGEGIYIFKYPELRAWMQEQVRNGLKHNHFSPDDKPNENYKVHKDVLLKAVSYSFISVEDIMGRDYKY